MPPGVYTFTITGKTPVATGITQVSVTTTVTWELVDPCLTLASTFAMPDFTTASFTYTISGTEQADNALPVAATNNA